MPAFEITVENFENEVINSEKPVLVDFWAAWCGPCQILSPVIEEISKEADGIKVGKVNVDEQGVLVEKYSVMNIPTLLLFKSGELVNKSVGVKSKEDILKMINSL